MVLIGVTPSAADEGVNKILRVNRDYMDAVIRAGAAPVLLPLPGEGISADAILRLFDRLDGVLFTGGGDVDPALYGQPVTFSGPPEPARDQLEFPLMQRCLQEDKPFFAICRGIQVMNVLCGGTLFQDINEEMPDSGKHTRSDVPRTPVHAVSILPDTLLSRILNTASLQVNSRHHQAAAKIGQGLSVCARAQDGVIEGLEVPGHPFALGVQWHPESLAASDHCAQQLFNAFVRACEAHAAQTIRP